MSTSEEKLKELTEELYKDVTINEFNLREVQMRLPAIRHKWVARLMSNKFEHEKMKELRGSTKHKLIEKIKNEAQFMLSDLALNKQAEDSEIIAKIDSSLKNKKLIIEFLERVVDEVLKGITFDIKNLIRIIELENT